MLNLLSIICRLGIMAMMLVITSPAWADDATGNESKDTVESDSDTLHQEERFNNPGSIVKRLENDAKKKDYIFQIPGGDALLKPWYDMKAGLDEDYGLKFGVSYTSIYKKASDVFGPEDSASGFDLDISGTWTFLERNSESPTMLGFDFLWRDTLNSDITPQALFTQFGSLYSTDAPYGEEEPVIGELWLQHKFNKSIGFRAGKIFPITAYDFFPFKNFRTDFTDFNHVTNNAIPLPSNGLGAFGMYRPDPAVMLRLGVHDANANIQESGLDTFDNEYFTIAEAGFDIGLTPRSPGGPPNGHAHVSLWHQDSREDAGIDEGWGVAGTLLQRFGNVAPFIRYGYADNGPTGPTPVKHMANIGVVFDDIFGQTNDRIGVGYTWSDPANDSLNNQDMIDSYYRIQLTPQIQVGPTFQAIFDPVNNPIEDEVYVYGFRWRVNL